MNFQSSQQWHAISGNSVAYVVLRPALRGLQRLLTPSRGSADTSGSVLSWGNLPRLCSVHLAAMV